MATGADGCPAAEEGKDHGGRDIPATLQGRGKKSINDKIYIELIKLAMPNLYPPRNCQQSLGV